MRVLGIETTCDETAAAVVDDGTIVRSNVVLSQVPLHERFGGVVPEIASRAHVEAVTRIIERALIEAGIDPDARSSAHVPVDAIAVAHRPGLVGSLLVGVTAAKGLALAWRVPFVGVDHIHAHIFANCLTEANSPIASVPDRFPAISLVVSGGHTSLYRSESWSEHALIGNTLDDAAGEAFDKAAAILDLGYPGGPTISRHAAGGDPHAIDFPRTLLEPDSLDFSFSGIKTAVLYHVKGQNAKRDDASRRGLSVADVAASFEEAVVDVLVEKVRRALERERCDRLLLGGGVAANRRLRERLVENCRRLGVDLALPAARYCTDNAAMIAGLGARRLESGESADLTLEISPLTA
jgi:N6-L-threonylcarbamoyladenine synthase